MASEIERLLYREAHLLDSGQFFKWLDLLAPDLRYWAPARSDVSRQQELKDEARRLALFDETKASLTLRINRIGTGLAWAESPNTRTRRFISNVIDEQEAGGIVHVRSNFLLFKNRSSADETILVGCREDRWTRSDTWLLKERKILIDHCTVENMSLLL
jgi:3-phenylpropionate/cinnamic acid dioxygenase small subunit